MEDPEVVPSAVPDASMNPNPNVYQIGGVPVEFPYKPYGTQLVFMGRVISALEKSRRQGNSHALLESPTGTGKTLSLLCSTLAWQQHQLRRPTTDLATEVGSSEHLICGGGFIPDDEPEPSRSSEQTSSGHEKAKKRNITPTIYYATRTHSQISQAIREYSKTSYRVPMAVLAARKRYCTNKNVCGRENMDEECKNLLKLKDLGCPNFKNVQKIKSHPSLKQGGCHEVHDIEDLVKIGRSVKGCSYFAAQAMAAEAKLVFCPYSYVISPTVRKAMDIDIKGSILILDEAHNMEDVAREAGSVDIEDDVLHSLQAELGQLCHAGYGSTYQPLHDMVQGIICWIEDRKNSLQLREFERYVSHWTGNNAIVELQQAGITQHGFSVLFECATKAIKDASDVESDEMHLTGISLLTLDGLCTSLSYFFSNNCSHATDYQLLLQRYVKRGNASCEWTYSLGLWCLNPAVVFREIASLSRSIILTSGTLCPMSSFASELGVQFETCMEAPHVIDMDSQLWAAVIPSGSNFRLNASYKTADSYRFQDELGDCLEKIFKIAPGGALVFFPSYKLLEKLQNRWRQTGQWDRFNAQKPVYVEPRGNADELEPILKGYYNSIRGNHTPTSCKLNGTRRQVVKHSGVKLSEHALKGAAALFAVCRGKVSEGIDFSDDNARVVVIVGIPFPNTNDIQVVLKKKYNDSYRLSKNLLSGSDWYCHQAFRALNQAAGRCIRHKSDYGAVILLDERYEEERNIAHVSKWLRKSVRKYCILDRSLDSLCSFFEVAEKRFCIERNSAQEIKSINVNTDYGKLQSPNAFLKKKGLTDKNLNKRKVQSKNTKTANNTDETSKKSFCDQETYVDIDDSCKDTYVTNSKPSSKFLNVVISESVFSRAASYSEDTENVASPSHVVNNNEVFNYGNDRSSSVGIGKRFPLVPFSSDKSNRSSEPCISTDYFKEHTHTEVCNRKLGLCSNSLSVNSSIQKRRKLTDSELNAFPHMVSLSSVDNACYQVNCESKNTSEPSKLSEIMSRSDTCFEQKLDISCSVCFKSLGLYQNDFLVGCSQTSTSKSFVVEVLRDGTISGCNVKVDSRFRVTEVKVIVSSIEDLDPLLFIKCTNGGVLERDTWSEKDGCVFRTIFCPFCINPTTCLGLQVVAVDKSNIHLLNKVFLYTDRLYLKT